MVKVGGNFILWDRDGVHPENGFSVIEIGNFGKVLRNRVEFLFELEAVTNFFRDNGYLTWDFSIWDINNAFNGSIFSKNYFKRVKNLIICEITFRVNKKLYRNLNENPSFHPVHFGPVVFCGVLRIANVFLLSFGL